MFAVVRQHLSSCCSRAFTRGGWLILILLSFGQFPVYAQKNVRQPASHPDGFVGKPSVKLEAGYASVSGDEEYLFHDISIGDVTVTAVLAPALAVGARARMARQADSSRTSADAMARLYLGSPLTVAEPSGCNPDGRVGLPIVVVTGGADLADGGRGVDRWRVDAALALPLSSHWSLGAGYLWLEKLRPGDPVQGYGLVRWYSHAYSAGALYENPDGLPGTVNVAFRAGASSRGSLGQLDFRVPLDGGTTVGVGGEVISLDARSEKRLTARISLTWYPH